MFRNCLITEAKRKTGNLWRHAHWLESNYQVQEIFVPLFHLNYWSLLTAKNVVFIFVLIRLRSCDNYFCVKTLFLGPSQSFRSWTTSFVNTSVDFRKTCGKTAAKSIINHPFKYVKVIYLRSSSKAPSSLSKTIKKFIIISA